MQDLNKYISGLLFIHDCVILPGFGGFVTNYKSAGHSEVSHTFTPPRKDVLFNKHITYNDGLLINYLSRNMNISYKEAEQKIKDEVQRAWVKLDKGEKVVFDGVGTFYYDTNKKIVFTPEDTENYLTDSYGLSSFRFPPLDYQKESTHKVLSLYKNGDMDGNVKKTVRWAVAASVIALAVIAVIVPYQKKANEQTAGVTFDTVSEKPIEVVHSAIPEDTNVVEVIDKYSDKRTALFYTEEPKMVEKKQNTDGYMFYIIGASYKNEKKANEHAEMFKNKGFEATVLNVDNLYRVALCSFNSKVNALHELRRIRNEEHNNQVWLYSQKLQ